MGTTGLVGRAAELARLEKALAETGEQGGALILTGPVGIGKTALLAAISERARASGHTVLSVTGVESEAGLPYAGLHQLLQPSLSALDALPQPQRSALLTALGTGHGKPPDVFLVGLATLNLLGEVSGDSPLLVVADDFQWLDQPSSSVLSFVARRLEATHILLVLGSRESTDLLSEIRVEPLSRAAATELLDSVAPDLDVQTRRLILDEALGNPLALVELPRAFRQYGADGREGALRSVPLTDRLTRTFSAQARQLPIPTQTALLFVALDKDPSVGDVLAATNEVSLEVLQPAIDAGLISIAGSTVRFRHPMIRSAVEKSAAAAERRNAHLRLAEVVADPDRRAWHRAKAALGEDERAAADLEATGRRAQDRGAAATALGALELAASLTPPGPPRVRRLLSAAELAFQVGDAPAVGRLLDAASRQELTDGDAARVTWLREIFHDGAPGDANAVARLVTAAREVASHGDQNLALNLLQGAAWRCWWAEPGGPARRLVIAALDEIGAEGLDPRTLEIVSLADPVDSGDRVSRDVVAAAEANHADAVTTLRLGVAAHGAGAYGQALELLNTAAPGLRADGRLGLLAGLLSCRTWIEIHVGNFADALRDGEEGNSVATETQQPNWIAVSEIALGRLAGLRGDEARAKSFLDDAESRVAPLRLSSLLSAVQLARGLVALTSGRNGGAYDHFARMFDPDDIAFNELESFAAAGYVIAAAVQADRRDEADRLMPRLESLGQRSRSELLHVGLRYARAMTAADSDAEDLWETAIASEPKWPFDHALAQLSFGAWLRRRRRITEARSHLRSAQEIFEALGVQPWAEKARLELRASGERAAEPLTAPRRPLSAQELQIAQLAAAGLSNREIGDRLFLSHRTVGAHLYRVFPKLGVASRSELARALAAVQAGAVASQGGV
ncbi:MAG TPA: AAA family ATPase [Candidatus Dormibacteraeota bacterium]|nr:AAA family ATPase [Candidatus Dormibacteraeota bacterium]